MKQLLSTLLFSLLLIRGISMYGREFPVLHALHMADTGSICVDTSLHLLLQEDTLAVSAGSVAGTSDGNLLIPGYYYPDNGIFYNMPYLLKCTPGGSILWSRKFNNSGSFPSLWITASRIKELRNGDLLMTGQIGVPGTDDRRELAVWRLDRNGSVLWATSYESTLWSDPITGATEITGILEDAGGNIFLSGNLKIFEASKFAFVLEMDAAGKVIWDKDFAGSAVFGYGALLLQGNLLLIGGLDPVLVGDNSDKNLIWCIQMNPANGQVLKTKGWSSAAGLQPMWNSFLNANTTVFLLDNGLISVCGTSYADFRGPVALMTDTLSHSIVAQFSPDFTFQSGMMISSGQASNYFNTVTSQRPDGNITYSRFDENNRLYNENILYGSIHGNRIFRERFYQEQNRSSQVASSFLYPLPDEDFVIQTFWDSTAGKGGLEILRLRDGDTTAVCNGRDTSLSFLQPFSMNPFPVPFDSVMTNTFHQTYHNEVSVSPGSMSIVTACRLSGVSVRANPVVSLDRDSVLCQGTERQLNAGAGFAQYTWSNGNTDSTILVTDTGRYWVSVLGQDGCRGSDTTYIARVEAVPAGYLPPDTTICEFSKLTIAPSHSFQSYLWSDQSTGPTLTVSQPGYYALQVTDSNQCTGNDSIRLTQKPCVLGLYVPNAFTPNGDGRNDLFRPLLVGNVVWFRFSVYNRWGQKVFETSEAGKGWDGKVNGTPAQDDAFVWYCQYQLAGEAETIKRGTVLLLH